MPLPRTVRIQHRRASSSARRACMIACAIAVSLTAVPGQRPARSSLRETTRSRWRTRKRSVSSAFRWIATGRPFRRSSQSLSSSSKGPKRQITDTPCHSHRPIHPPAIANHSQTARTPPNLSTPFLSCSCRSSSSFSARIDSECGPPTSLARSYGSALRRVHCQTVRLPAHHEDQPGPSGLALRAALSERRWSLPHHPLHCRERATMTFITPAFNQRRDGVTIHEGNATHDSSRAIRRRRSPFRPQL